MKEWFGFEGEKRWSDFEDIFDGGRNGCGESFYFRIVFVIEYLCKGWVGYKNVLVIGIRL